MVFHGSWAHLRADSIWMLGLGLLLEPVIGSARLARAMLFTLATSTLIELFFQAGSYGSSGIVYGLQGVLLARPFRTNRDGCRAVSWAWLVVAWLTLWDLPWSQFDADIGFAGHAGGLIGGVCFGGLWASTGQVADNPRGAQNHRVALAVSMLGLTAAFALNPRWSLDWHSRCARHSELAGDFSDAASHWEAVERLGDPSSRLDAIKLDAAARYWNRRSEPARARHLMSAVASTLGPLEYVDLGLFQACREPREERAALDSWAEALKLDPCQPEVLDYMAEVYLSPRDTTLYLPEKARELAWSAVRLDGIRTPAYIRTLAAAQLQCGNTREAIRWLRKAIALKPKDSATYCDELAQIEKQAAVESERPD